MTTDERIAQIKKWEKCGSATALFDVYADVRFLLAELDAALAREATLREALEQLVHAIEAHQAHAWATSDIDTAAARAALAEGEDTK